jgi:hypothetical protein
LGLAHLNQKTKKPGCAWQPGSASHRLRHCERSEAIHSQAF